MTISQVRGRLGNILFSVACGAYYAFKNNEDLKVHVESDQEYYDKIQPYMLPQIKKVLPEDFQKDYYGFEETSPITYEMIPQTEGNVYIGGYRQSPLYFTESFVQNLFCFNNAIEEEARKIYNIDFSNIIAIHVRRGDYLNDANIPLFFVRNKEYYEKFIDSFSNNQKFIFFSDDIDWCKNNFNTRSNCYFADKKSDNIPTELVDLYLISTCREILISNSTFSWWGAYLNQNKNKKIYYTLPWMKIPFKCDIIPNDKRWIEVNYSHLKEKGGGTSL